VGQYRPHRGRRVVLCRSPHLPSRYAAAFLVRSNVPP
jgi:hypothetical protein